MNYLRNSILDKKGMQEWVHGYMLIIIIGTAETGNIILETSNETIAQQEGQFDLELEVNDDAKSRSIFRYNQQISCTKISLLTTP